MEKLMAGTRRMVCNLSSRRWAIVGKTKEGSLELFFCSNKLYGDFDLQFEVKLSMMNSIQVSKSAHKPEN